MKIESVCSECTVPSLWDQILTVLYWQLFNFTTIRLQLKQNAV